MSYFSHSWLPYIYQYGLGAVIFVVGLVITLKTGSFDIKRKVHRRWLGVLLFGFVWYATLHGALTLAALGHEAVAAAGGVVVMAATVAGVWALDRRLKKRGS